MELDSPAIVSITTLPSRLPRIRPTLESLLAGNRVPDRILLALPETSVREGCGYVLPEFLKSAPFADKVMVVRSPQDFGPGTKLLGALPAITSPSYLVIADDDVRYRPFFLEALIAAQAADHASSFSFYTYKRLGLTIGQGCDGFSFWTPDLAGIRSFAERHIMGTPLFFHDDLWISFYLASRNIAVRSLQPLLDGGLVYEQVHDILALRDMTGAHAREELNRRGIRTLVRRVPLPLSRKLAIHGAIIRDSGERTARALLRPVRQAIRKP